MAHPLSHAAVRRAVARRPVDARPGGRDPLAPARGILIGVLLGGVVWLLIGALLWLFLR